MAGPLPFLYLYGSAIRTGYVKYPNGCITGSAGTILQTEVPEGSPPSPLRITSFSHGGSVWFALAASDGEPYEIGNSNPETHGFVAGQTIYVDNSSETMPTEEFTNIAQGALNSGYYTLLTGPAVGAGGANIIALYENTANADLFVQPTGCDGVLNFSDATYTGAQGSTIAVEVTRTQGITGPVTASLAVTGGTAPASDFTFSPTQAFWENGDIDNKIFNITAINNWAPESLTVDIGITSIVGAFTGSDVTASVVTITNEPIVGQPPDPYPEISTDFTINSYKNMSSNYRRKTITQVPFSLGNKGPATIRDQSSAYSTSLG
tara:strand:+ start:2116 stop:3078 length:963 start_codon:yes stop_codon:yes gene_type:complete